MKWRVLLLVVALALMGCASARADIPAPTLTPRAPLPTFTPRASPSALPRAHPTQGETPLPRAHGNGISPLPRVDVLVPGRTLEAATLYAGPGTTYAVATPIAARVAVSVTARSADGKWLHLVSPLDGWVSVIAVELDPLPLLAIITPIATPARTGTATVTPTRAPSATATRK